MGTGRVAADGPPRYRKSGNDRLTAAARVSVTERLLSGKGEALVMGPDVPLKITRLRRQFEDLLARVRGQSEI